MEGMKRCGGGRGAFVLGVHGPTPFRMERVSAYVSEAGPAQLDAQPFCTRTPAKKGQNIPQEGLAFWEGLY